MTEPLAALGGSYPAEIPAIPRDIPEPPPSRDSNRDPAGKAPRGPTKREIEREAKRIERDRLADEERKHIARLREIMGKPPVPTPDDSPPITSLSDLVFRDRPPRSLSMSQINTFAEEPALWLMQVFFGLYGSRGPKLWIGNAVESAINAGLNNPALQYDDMLEILGNTYRRDAKDGVSNATPEDVLAGMDIAAKYLKTGFEVLARYGRPVGYQVKIEGYRLPGIDFPIYGKIDWLYPECHRDCKTTERVPSEPKVKPDNGRQATIYADARGLDQAWLIYVGTEKHMEVPLSEDDMALGRFHTRALAEPMDRILNNFQDAISDPEGVIWRSIFRMYPPRDLTSYRWDDRLRQAAGVIWHYA